MIKGITLGVTISIFITSLIFIISGTFGTLQANIITGHTIGEGTITGYAFVVLILSFIGLLSAVLWIRKTS